MVQSIAKAAQYLRMSTDMQRYSIENQAEVIGLYAASRGLTITESYEDGGRSGVSLEGRPALKALLSDVTSRRTDFSIILVYDVSRWGRFQDSDESAHYEYLCRQSGVTVEYCAELFENDGSVTATVIKNIKRAMAGEFSRELSVKVFAGQRRLVLNGYHVGSTAGYGLRRMLLDERGRPKFELSKGQRKSLQTERVILVPGPPHEVKIVHRIYDMFLDSKQGAREIAQKLNDEGVAGEFGRNWSQNQVLSVLSNEKYIGNAVYNRTSIKLKGKWRRNSRAEWICKPGAYEAIVSRDRFDEAAKRIVSLNRSITRNEMLDQLTALWCKSGHLSTYLVDRSRYTLSANTYGARFGSLSKAFRLIGFRNRENIGTNTDLRKKIAAELTAEIVKRGGTVDTRHWNRQIIVNGEIGVNIKIGRLKTGGPRVWQFGYVSPTNQTFLSVLGSISAAAVLSIISFCHSCSCRMARG
jgi:DNA invertase Pin-like site-specific DNA recombinase